MFNSSWRKNHLRQCLGPLNRVNFYTMQLHILLAVLAGTKCAVLNCSFWMCRANHNCPQTVDKWQLVVLFATPKDGCFTKGLSLFSKLTSPRQMSNKCLCFVHHKFALGSRNGLFVRSFGRRVIKVCHESIRGISWRIEKTSVFSSLTLHWLRNSFLLATRIYLLVTVSIFSYDTEVLCRSVAGTKIRAGRWTWGRNGHVQLHSQAVQAGLLQCFLPWWETKTFVQVETHSHRASRAPSPERALLWKCTLLWTIHSNLVVVFTPGGSWHFEMICEKWISIRSPNVSPKCQLVLRVNLRSRTRHSLLSLCRTRWSGAIYRVCDRFSGSAVVAAVHTEGSAQRWLPVRNTPGHGGLHQSPGGSGSFPSPLKLLTRLEGDRSKCVPPPDPELP